MNLPITSISTVKNDFETLCSFMKKQIQSLQNEVNNHQHVYFDESKHILLIQKFNEIKDILNNKC